MEQKMKHMNFKVDKVIRASKVGRQLPQWMVWSKKLIPIFSIDIVICSLSL